VNFQEKKTYMVKDLMEAFGFSYGKIVKLIEHESDVIRDRNLGPAVGKQSYTNWRIPGFVAERLRQRLTEKPLQAKFSVNKPRRVVPLSNRGIRVAKKVRHVLKPHLPVVEHSVGERVT
jgi:hypothetical protein